MKAIFALFTIYIGAAVCQQAGVVTPENHPNITIQKCTKSGGCVSQTNKLVLDANWRWLHSVSQPYGNCFSYPSWNATWCPDPTTCAQNCAYDGASYQSSYGVYASGPNLTMLLYPAGSTGSRLYLLSDDTHYQTFQLKNQELSFDVDVSGLPCGANGALYFVNMAADGGQSLYPTNKAGAKFGTGYCDAQCRQDLQFVDGQANLLNWNTNSQTGRYGTCCHEMDVWEANAVSTAYTAHTCSILGQTRCDSTTSACSSYCDSSGCDFNAYRMGNTTFYGQGSGATVSTLPGKMRVITQFITSNGTAAGTLTEIRRYYIRTPKGQVIANAASDISGVSGNSLTDAYCTAESKAFNAGGTFESHGGMASMDQALSLGMVLTLSVYVDYAYNMNWLDSVFPSGASPSTPGALRGGCSTTAGAPANVQANYPNAQVQFSNIKYGDIGTTFGPPYP